MAKQFPEISPALREFILRQRMFFTASAATTGRVNVSPRGTDMLRVLGPNAVVYLDLTGSGNETAAHLRATGRLTVMFCAFEGAPMILRLYGTGQVLRRGGPDYARLLAAEFGGVEPLGARQMVRLDIWSRPPAASACRCSTMPASGRPWRAGPRRRRGRRGWRPIAG